MFKLDSKLERDTFFITDLKLCRLLLMDNSLFPWLIMVPMRENAVDLIDLSREDLHLLTDEIFIVSHIFKAITTADKLNVANLGNKTPQLHIHVIGRYHGDPAWPDAVWGKASEPYSHDQSANFIKEIKLALDSTL